MSYNEKIKTCAWRAGTVMSMNSDTQKTLYKIGCAKHVVQGDLEGLVFGWVKVVAHVSKGYQMTIDDYLNDIDGRHLIHVFTGQAPSQFTAPYKQRLKAADEKFMASTTETVGCIWGVCNEKKHHWSRSANWYYYRKPIIGNSELTLE
ncbi:hypothetical protein HHX48_11805 [Salinimonas sp. HHU 13199]|uniref:ASCH domain-containing protein n=1 Tax=Salinimonas profundi TaxID=2729140 RepID=A0ABR8LJP6_9ALTE|nr:hypothetical protein [Salinimonas profundi]MBD3586424.1 hypothetical protein [Salinimonas profundi]